MDGPEYAVGRFTLRPNRQLLEAESPVAIGRKGLQLLSVLAEARGALVTKDELMERVWPQSIVEDNALQAQVVALRKLLGDDGGRLITVRGLGYRLEATPASATEPIAAPGPGLTPADRPSVAASPDERPTPWRAGGALRRPRLQLQLGAAALVAAVGAAVVLAPMAGRSPARPADSAALPADPAAAALLLQARDEWAQRDAAGLTRSIAHFQRVTRLAPRFAPAFADLADAYLLSGEAGSLPDAVAYDAAEHAAASAQALDPNLAGAHRAMGFVLYWWRHDRAGAAAAFQTALRLDPASSQTHFWYANILADNGEFPAALREFDRARLADPGSDQIAADHAWALWSAGREAEALQALRTIVAQRPTNSEARDCLADVLLSQGDFKGALDALQARARLRREPNFDARIQALAEAYARGGGPELLRTAVAREMAAQADAPYPDHAAAAFYASLAGDRAAVLAALAAADASREVWGSAGLVRRVRARWAGDTAITSALDRRIAPRIEPRA